MGACHDFGCVGSLAGIYTASMPAFVVENRAFGNVACCNIYEGSNPRRLNYGVYDDGVRDRLLLVQNEIVPVIAEALRQSGGIPLKPIIKRALGMGDELHSRNTAAALLFLRELVPDLLVLASSGSERIVRAVKTMTDDHHFFLRLSMAAAKATADAARDVERSSVVTAMAFNCRGFSVRVSGLGDTWFNGPHASVEAKLFEGTPRTRSRGWGRKHHRRDDRPCGFAQASAPSLQTYQGGSYETMIARNKELYAITVGENPTISFRRSTFAARRRASTSSRSWKKRCFPSSMSASPAGMAGRSVLVSCGRRLHVSRKPPRLIASAMAHDISA